VCARLRPTAAPGQICQPAGSGKRRAPDRACRGRSRDPLCRSSGRRASGIRPGRPPRLSAPRRASDASGKPGPAHLRRARARRSRWKARIKLAGVRAEIDNSREERIVGRRHGPSSGLREGMPSARLVASKELRVPGATHIGDDLDGIIGRLTFAWPETKLGDVPDPAWRHPRHHYDLMLVAGFVVAVDVVCARREDVAKVSAPGEAIRQRAGGFPDAWFIASTLAADPETRARVAGFGWCLCRWPASPRIRALSRRAPQPTVTQARRRASALSAVGSAR
jgi:hypothetical protein